MDEAIATEIVGPRPKRDERGRRITTAGEREALLSAYRESGLTQRAFAQREGIKYSTFTSWVQGLRGVARAAAASSPPAPPSAMRFLEARLPAMVGGIEVTLPDGTKLRGNDARELAALIAALRR